MDEPKSVHREVKELDTSSPPSSIDLANGTAHDAEDMARLGKKQQFQRNFKYLTILGFTSTLMATWEAVFVSAGLALVDGGLARLIVLLQGFVWTFFATTFCFGAVISSMADMASMAPTTGGQYHWVSEFAPKSKQRFLSYLVGWTSALGWQCGVAAASYLSATMIQGLLVLNYETYTPTRWEGTLLMIAVLFVCTLVNTIGAKHLPLFEGIILVLHIAGFFAIIIPLWAIGPKVPAKVVFTQFYNGGGWSSVGSACMIAQLATVFSFIGPDGAAHMAEEVHDASRTVPRVMISTVILNGVLGFVAVVTFCFCITDLPAALMTTTGYPFIEVFYATTGSKAGTIVMSVILILLLICCGISQLATASRQAFAFARDDGLPFPHIWSKVVKVGVEIPLNSLLVSLSIAVLISLINIGSTAAFNSISSLLVAAEFTSYLISIGCILLKRIRKEPLPPSRWSMGAFALPINIFSVCYIIFVFVMSFFPTSKAGLNPQNMNWSSLVYAVVVGFSVVLYYVHGRHVYKGPVVKIRRD
ncbi:amino acid transporter [Microthyrium microscopicum]|uniref:Amino acid transporter n=1 Tax=Microthyrium microscopicum TaxID=703497 RepID=A0A6A6U6E1_9PEZI|nr:amino acid transporter [Microthyrium microscopicum]